MASTESLREDVKYRINNLSKLATLPSVAQSIIELANNPKSNASDLEKVINTDQVLTSRVLKTANSAYYGFQKEVSTVRLAVVILGFDTIKGLALSCSIIENLNFDESFEGFDLKSFWEHSITTAVIAQSISKVIGHTVAGEAFVAGLLHDIGLLVLVEEFRDQFSEIYQEFTTTNTSLNVIETKLLGCTHMEIGYWLMEKWNFPETLRNAIRYHSDFMSMEKFHLAKTIEVSEKLSCFHGFSGPLKVDVTENDLLNLLTPKEYANINAVVEETLDKSSELFKTLIPVEQ